MRFYSWQEQILRDGYDIIEVIAPKGCGKSTLGIAWGMIACDELIVLTKDRANFTKEANDIKDSMSGKVNIKVLASLRQLRDVPTHPKKRYKVLVDEYFINDFKLDDIDKAMGHTDYQIMFVGTRTKMDDTFKLPHSKWYNIQLLDMVLNGAMSPVQIEELMKTRTYEQFLLDYNVNIDMN